MVFVICHSQKSKLNACTTLLWQPTFYSRTVAITGALQLGWHTTLTTLSTPRPVSADHCNSLFNSSVAVGLHLNLCFFETSTVYGQQQINIGLYIFLVSLRYLQVVLCWLSKYLTDAHLWVFLLSQFCQVGNFSIHIALRNLKPPGEHFGTVIDNVFLSKVSLVFLSRLRFENQEDSLPNEKSIHMDFLAGVLS